MMTSVYEKVGAREKRGQRRSMYARCSMLQRTRLILIGVLALRRRIPRNGDGIHLVTTCLRPCEYGPQGRDHTAEMSSAQRYEGRILATFQHWADALQGIRTNTENGKGDPVAQAF